MTLPTNRTTANTAAEHVSDHNTVHGFYNTHPTDPAAHSGTYVGFLQLARDPDLIIVGAITRNADEAVTSAPVVWPDGALGTFTATVLSSSFPGAVDAYTVTYGSPVTRTYTQPTMTRDSAGAVTVRPALVVT